MSEALYQRGLSRVRLFCDANDLVPTPTTERVSRTDWFFSECAYWRPNTTNICVDLCARPAPFAECRNWNWPGSTTDREPYGVLAHELGHCADWHNSTVRGEYFGNCSMEMRKESGEKPLTSYCPNDAEWFAEHFRLFVTNHALLRLLRPRTHALMMNWWTPVSGDDWREELGPDVPPRIVRAILNKAPRQLSTQQEAHNG